MQYFFKIESRTHRTFQTKNPLVSSKSEDFLFGR